MPVAKEKEKVKEARKNLTKVAKELAMARVTRKDRKAKRRAKEREKEVEVEAPTTPVEKAVRSIPLLLRVPRMKVSAVMISCAVFSFYQR